MNNTYLIHPTRGPMIRGILLLLKKLFLKVHVRIHHRCKLVNRSYSRLIFISNISFGPMPRVA